MKSIERRVHELIASTLEVNERDIRPDSTWEDYGVDSLAIVELVFALEEHFGMSFEIVELDEIKSAADVVRVIEDKVGAGASTAPSGASPGTGSHRRSRRPNRG